MKLTLRISEGTYHQMRNHDLTNKMVRVDGFTLINLLVAVSLALVITAIVIPGAIKASQDYKLLIVTKGIVGSLLNARITAGQMQTGHLEQNLDLYRSALPIIGSSPAHC